MPNYKKALFFVICIVLSSALMGCGERTVVVSEHYVYESDEGEASSEEPSSSEVKASSSVPQSSSNSSAETSSVTVYQIPKRKIHPNDVKSITVNGVDFPVRLIDKEAVPHPDLPDSLGIGNYIYLCEQDDKRREFEVDVKTGWLLKFDLIDYEFEEKEPLTSQQIKHLADNYFKSLYTLNIDEFTQEIKFYEEDNHYYVTYEKFHCGRVSDRAYISISSSGNIFKLRAYLDTYELFQTVEKVDESEIFAALDEYAKSKNTVIETGELSRALYVSDNGKPALHFGGTDLGRAEENERYRNSEYVVEFNADGTYSFYEDSSTWYK